VSGADQAMDAARRRSAASRRAHREFARSFAERCERERRAKALADADQYFPAAVRALRGGRYLHGATTIGGRRTAWKFAETTERHTIMGDELTSTLCWWFDLERRVYRSGGGADTRAVAMDVEDERVPAKELFDTLDRIAKGQTPKWRGPIEPPPDLRSLPLVSSASGIDWPAWCAMAMLAAIAVVELVAILR
jgi:hypothetical protein